MKLKFVPTLFARQFDIPNGNRVCNFSYQFCYIQGYNIDDIGFEFACETLIFDISTYVNFETKVLLTVIFTLHQQSYDRLKLLQATLEIVRSPCCYPG